MNEEKYKNMSLRERFDAKCLGVVKYARSHALSQSTLSRVLNSNDETTGRVKTTHGITRKVFTQLKLDGIWIGSLPWEK